jgi:oxygen-independent coproporphyrinogen-3 oxidase
VDTAGTPRAVAAERIESPRQIVVEFLMNALRLPDGIPFDEFERRTGQPRATLDVPLRGAIDRGWISERDDLLQPTASGLQMLNSLVGLFVV